MNKFDLEILLRKILPFYLIFVYILTILGAFYSFLIHHHWIYADMLINYQGGFVRRGFIGEVIYQFALISKINPGFIAFLVISITYTFIFYFSYKLLKMQDRLLPYIFLIFSPFIFNFQLFGPVFFNGGCRKEILFFAVLSILIFK